MYPITDHQTGTGRKGYLWSSLNFAKFCTNFSSCITLRLADSLLNPIFMGTSEETYPTLTVKDGSCAGFPQPPGTSQCWDFQGGQTPGYPTTRCNFWPKTANDLSVTLGHPAWGQPAGNRARCKQTPFRLTLSNMILSEGSTRTSISPAKANFK